MKSYVILDARILFPDISWYPFYPEIVNKIFVDSDEFESELTILYRLMENEGIQFFSPGGSFTRRLITLLQTYHDYINGLDHENRLQYINTFKANLKLAEQLYNVFMKAFNTDLFEYDQSTAKKINEWVKDGKNICLYSEWISEQDMLHLLAHWVDNLEIDRPESIFCVDNSLYRRDKNWDGASPCLNKIKEHFKGQYCYKYFITDSSADATEIGEEFIRFLIDKSNNSSTGKHILVPSVDMIDLN